VVLLFSLDLRDLTQQTMKNKKLLEDIRGIGVKIYSYRHIVDL
jgi:hypothetical protein